MQKVIISGRSKLELVNVFKCAVLKFIIRIWAVDMKNAIYIFKITIFEEVIVSPTLQFGKFIEIHSNSTIYPLNINKSIIVTGVIRIQRGIGPVNPICKGYYSLYIRNVYIFQGIMVSPICY